MRGELDERECGEIKFFFEWKDFVRAMVAWGSLGPAASSEQHCRKRRKLRIGESKIDERSAWSENEAYPVAKREVS